MGNKKKNQKSVKKLEFASKMEGFTDEQIKERIQYALDYEIPHKIKSIPYLGTEELIDYEYEELVARCPVTGILDLYKIKISFIPDKLIPELKSLKFYFLDYDPLPISHEHLVEKVFDDFTEIVKPRWIRIELNVAIRGGIKTKVTKERFLDEKFYEEQQMVNGYVRSWNRVHRR